MKILKILLAGAAMVALTACSGNGKTAAEDSSASTIDKDGAFYETQPLESGEYRVVSFQDAAPGSQRTRFDGRMIISVTPESTNIYIYENGNRTKFSSVIALGSPFEKSDSLYVSKDVKNQAVDIIPGSENDTLSYTKAGTPVKIAFERKPMSTYTSMEALQRITDKRTENK